MTMQKPALEIIRGVERRFKHAQTYVILPPPPFIKCSCQFIHMGRMLFRSVFFQCVQQLVCILNMLFCPHLRHGRCWQTIYQSVMFSYLYKTPTPTPLVNCKENIEQNIICQQIYDTVISPNTFLGLLLARIRFWCSFATT